MAQIELTAGTIEYEDTRGDGPTLVLLGGVLMPGSVWDPVTELLAPEHRCIVVDMPLGGHRIPLKPDAGLKLDDYATMVAELLDRLDLNDVTLVQNDHAAALVLAGRRPKRVARLVLSSCEAFENFPPGLPGKNLRLSAFVPGAIYMAVQALRIRPVRRLPIAFGWLTKSPLPHELLDEWLKPVQSQRGVRRDLRRYVAGARRRDMVAACDQLKNFDRPALVVWTPEDRIQKPDHGRRLAEILPNSELLEISESRTLIMRDQPKKFADAIRKFVADGVV